MAATLPRPGARRRHRLGRLLAAAATFWALGPSSSALASAQQTGTPETAAAAVVVPETAPSVMAVFREVPIDLWRFVSVDTAVVLAAGGEAARVHDHNTGPRAGTDRPERNPGSAAPTNDNCTHTMTRRNA